MNQSNLPLESERPPVEGNHQLEQSDIDTPTVASLQTERSSLWAAYGDALGWISELTDSRGLKRRTGGKPLERPIPWKRRIGGRSGVQATLPQGCYSDDSQLRLATARSIRASGFDVEAFAKVELPVWVSYGLGGGRSTTAAAVNLGNQKAVWWANRFKGWTNSGGNGAAMRIQPHVWAAAPPYHQETYLMDVVRNTVCTHSHPVGIMGAVLHAHCLGHVMRSGRLPSADHLEEALEQASELPDWIKEEAELLNWLTAFEEEAGSFAPAWKETVEEARQALDRVMGTHDRSKSAPPEDRYVDLLDALDLRNAQIRGSGMLTALAAVGLTWCEARPCEAMRIAANALGSDTDTIATMAGALIGSVADADPPVEVLDGKLFRSEAKRLACLACGEKPSSHQYPDLLHWSPPKSRSDMLAQRRNGELCVQGLGRAKSLDEPILSAGRFKWQWIKLELGQTLLIKRRGDLPWFREDKPSQASYDDNSRTPQAPRVQSGSPRNLRGRDQPRSSLSHEVSRQRGRTERTKNVQQTVDFLCRHIEDDASIGNTLKRVAQTGTPDEFAGVVSVLRDLLRRASPAQRDAPTSEQESKHEEERGTPYG